MSRSGAHSPQPHAARGDAAEALASGLGGVGAALELVHETRRLIDKRGLEGRCPLLCVTGKALGVAGVIFGAGTVPCQTHLMFRLDLA